MTSYTRHWQNLATITLVMGLLFSSTTAVTAETITYEQLPGHFGGFSSDGTVWTVADEFQLSGSTLITKITWWGGYGGTNLPTPSTDNFTIQLFADNAGHPGALLQVFQVGNNAQRTATGDFVNPPDPGIGFVGRPEFQYSFNLPTVFQADANLRYWLSIVNVPNWDSWVWEVSDSPDNPGVQRSFQGGPWEPFLDNTAFQLQTGEDTQPLMVIIDIKPWGLPNSINPRSRGVIPVAILSDSTFHAPSQVDKASLTFGRTGNESSLARCSSQPKDVNRDGRLDLLCKFTTQASGFQPRDTLGILKGMTVTGTPLSGTDSVKIVP